MLWLILACGPAVDTDCPPQTWYADADADGHGSSSDTVAACEAPSGYVAAGDDCDDADSAVFPGAIEACDGLDQDCDGIPDDGLTAYADTDGDNYGDRSATVGCLDGVADATDCDDARADVYPGAPERCDGLDQDCDGATDEDVIDPPTWYPDADGDGWGVAPGAAVQCEPIAGHASASGDCDDADPAFSPGATDVCENGLDEDCDGPDDCRMSGDWDTGHAAFRILGETASEGLEYAGPLDTPGGPGLFVASLDHLWLFRSVPGSDVFVSEAQAVVTLDGTSPASSSLAQIGDIDADGWEDLVFSSSVSSSAEAIHLISSGATSGDLSAVGWAQLTSSSGARAMVVGRRAADVTGDGSLDFAVGSGMLDTVWLIPGASVGGTATVEDTATTTVRAASGTFFGASVAVGDLDGDGMADLVVGADEYDSGTYMDPEGSMFVFYAPLSATLATIDADVAILGKDQAWLGDAVHVVDDLDGDGLDDLMAHDSSTWLLWSGPLASGSNTERAQFTTGIGSVDTGDLDGDGSPDLAWDESPWLDGLIHFGPVADGRHTSAASADARLPGDTVDLYPLLRVVGDLDSDGYDDLAALAPVADTTAANAGVAYIFQGSGF